MPSLNTTVWGTAVAPIILHVSFAFSPCFTVVEEAVSSEIEMKIRFSPVSCHLGPKGPNDKIVLIRFVHVHKKYKTRVGDRQRKSGYCGILAQKVSVRPSLSAH